MPHFAVDRDKRALVYAVSPSFARYRANIENEDTVAFQVSRIVYPGPADIPNGWMHFHFWEVIPLRYRDTLEWMQAVDREVTRACAEGRVACRSFVLPGPDTRLRVWLPALPEGFRDAYWASLGVGRVLPFTPDQFQDARFDLATARKAPVWMLADSRRRAFGIRTRLWTFYRTLYFDVIGPVFFPLLIACGAALFLTRAKRRAGAPAVRRPELERSGCCSCSSS